MKKEKFQQDKIIEELVKNSGMKTPSVDFTEKLMDKIYAAPAPVSPYQPLISRNVWFVIALFLGALILLLFIMQPVTEESVLDKFFQANLTFSQNIVAQLHTAIQNLRISSTFITAVVIGCVLLMFDFSSIIFANYKKRELI
ncbi:MAG: hypothetical protein JXJ22_15620 [Bacteroidales bacterium]|nr:hypothetical protein [Bacteroidales bacterium]